MTGFIDLITSKEYCKGPKMNKFGGGWKMTMMVHVKFTE